MKNQVYQKSHSESIEYLVYSYLCDNYFQVALSSNCIVVHNSEEFTATFCAPEGSGYILHECSLIEGSEYTLHSLNSYSDNSSESKENNNFDQDCMVEVLQAVSEVRAINSGAHSE